MPNQIWALASSLLRGEVLTSRKGNLTFGVSDLPHKIKRSIEKKFGVAVTRTKQKGRTRYGAYCEWLEYKLEHTEANQDGIKKMIQYINENEQKDYNLSNPE